MPSAQSAQPAPSLESPRPPEPDEPGRGLALPALAEIYDAYAAAAAELLELPGAMEAELWLSAQLGGLQAAAPHAEGHRLALADLLGVMSGAGTPGAAAFLRTFAAIGPVALRPAAGRAADALAGRGRPEPGWTALLGDVRSGDVASIQDGTLDREQIVCEFRYRDGSGHHALAVRLEQGLPTEVIAIGDVPGLMAQVRKAVEAEHCVLMRLDRATAGTRLRSAFAKAGALPEEHRGADWQNHEWFGYLAVTLHRIDVLARDRGPGGDRGA